MRLGIRHLELASAPLAPGHYNPQSNNSRLFNMFAEAGVSVSILRLTGLSYPQKLRAIAEAGERGIPAVLDRVERLTFPDLVDRLRIYSMCAAGAGIGFILENDSCTTCPDAQAQMTLSRIVRQPAMGFGFAPPHALLDRRDPAEELRVLGESLRLAYLWDASTEAAQGGSGWGIEDQFDPGPPEDQTPGNERGRMDWPAYFQTLAEIRFRGLFNLNWTGADDWDMRQIESAVQSSIQFCSAMADESGMGKF